MRPNLMREREIAIQNSIDLAKLTYNVIDFETTSFDGEVVQVAIIDQDKKPLVSTLVKPTFAISPGAQKVHGISMEMVKDSPTWPELWPTIRPLLHEQVVVAYNAEFERKILRLVTEQYKLEPAKVMGWYDPMLTYAKYHGEWNSYHRSFKWQKLEDACKRMGIEIDGAAHDALTDVKMTRDLIVAMAAATP